MTPPPLHLFHSVPASSRARFPCSAHTGRTPFAERGTGYLAESLTIAGSVEVVCLLSRAFRGSRTARVLEVGAAAGLTGAFDLAQFGWMGDAFPLSALTQIYASTGESNFGKIGSPEIDAKIEQTLQELDPAKARKLANEVDKLIWAEGFSLPLIQSPGNVAVNSSLANFGAAGLADLDYTAIGFMR
jgi:ABC-type transport system substrate-binding protein